MSGSAGAGGYDHVETAALMCHAAPAAEVADHVEVDEVLKTMAGDPGITE